MKYTICSLHDTLSKKIPGSFKFGHFQDGRQQQNGRNSQEDVCSKLISDSVHIEQHTSYQIEAKTLPFGKKIKYSN